MVRLLLLFTNRVVGDPDQWLLADPSGGTGRNDLEVTSVFWNGQVSGVGRSLVIWLIAEHDCGESTLTILCIKSKKSSISKLMSLLVHYDKARDSSDLFLETFPKTQQACCWMSSYWFVSVWTGWDKLFVDQPWALLCAHELVYCWPLSTLKGFPSPPQTNKQHSNGSGWHNQ